LQLRMGTLKLSDFWLRSVPTKDQGFTDEFGVAPLIIVAHKGHCEVVRFLGGVRSQQAGMKRVVENI